MYYAIRRFDIYGYPHVLTLIFKHNLWLMCDLPIKLAVPGEFKESTRSRIPADGGLIPRPLGRLKFSV